MEKMRDSIFKKPVKKSFEFDEEVASVFDDMIERSVPFYKEVVDLVADLAVKNLKENSLVYDLGSSTGNTLIEIHKKSSFNLRLVGIDSSEAMIKRACNKAAAYGADITFVKEDILNYSYEPCEMFIANYTLQFIRPLKREKFIKRIHSNLKEGGVFIFSEKIVTEDKRLSKQLIEIYHSYKKKQGYSDFEIAQKREALENVLIPYTMEENVEMVRSAGFSFVEPIFRWANFATFFARK